MIRNRRVKVVATLGPASNDYDTIRKLHEAGADVFRLNMSHGTHEDIKARHAIIRQVEEDLEALIQEALVMYKKINKLDAMGGEKGLRKRMLSYGSGLAEDDPERVTRAKQFLDLVKKRFEKLLKDDL